MEQKKTLWIIAAAGAFLLVVLGAACLLYSPVTRPCSTIASVSPVEKRTSQINNGWTNAPVKDSNTPVAPAIAAPVTAPQAQDVTISTAQDVVVVTDNTTVNGTTIDLNALKRELYQETPVSAQPQNINITVNIPEPAPVKETTTYIATPAVEKEQTVQKVAKAEPVKPAVQTKPVAQAKSAEKPKAAPAPAPKKVTQFWIQVAAYSNKKGAENARTILDDNKIPADIFTYKDNKDKLFYRVRVGPYTTKSEAEYWRTKIVKIDTFASAESFVTSTTN